MHFIENIVPYQKRANLAPSKTTDRASSSLRSRVERKKQHIRAWEGNDPSRKRRVYFGCYTAAFIVVAFITLFVYPSNGRALIWNIDGIEQYYPFFVYEGQWLREIVSNLLSGQGLQIPLWVHELGYGMDVPSTLDTFFDPLNLLSGLCPERYSEYLFQFLVVFRLYLAGAAFSLLALRFKIGRFPTLVGALLYALCGTAMAVAYWPAGAWPLVLFPLLLLGVEKVLAKERPYTFIAAVAAFFIISYYFSYMACLLLLPYCAVRVFQTQKSVNAVRFLGWTLRFFGLLAIGVLIACFALVPSLVGLFGLERFTDNSVTVPLFYSHHYYTSLASGFLSMAGVGSDCYIGFGGLAFLSCVLLFSKRRQNTSLKIAFVAGTIMLMVPAVGSFLNGMNYATNRWVWAYALVVCFIVARMLPSMLHLDKRSVKVLVIASIAYGAIVFAVAPMRTEAMLAAGVVLAATLFVVAQRGMAAKTRRMAVVCCLTAGLTVNAFYFVSPDEGGVGKLSSPLGYAYPRITSRLPQPPGLGPERSRAVALRRKLVGHRAHAQRQLGAGAQGLRFLQQLVQQRHRRLPYRACPQQDQHQLLVQRSGRPSNPGVAHGREILPEHRSGLSPGVPVRRSEQDRSVGRRARHPVPGARRIQRPAAGLRLRFVRSPQRVPFPLPRPAAGSAAAGRGARRVVASRNRQKAGIPHGALRRVGKQRPFGGRRRDTRFETGERR